MLYSTWNWLLHWIIRKEIIIWWLSVDAFWQQSMLLSWKITSWCIVHLDTKKKLAMPSTNCKPVKRESLMHPGAPVKHIQINLHAIITKLGSFKGGINKKVGSELKLRRDKLEIAQLFWKVFSVPRRISLL